MSPKRTSQSICIDVIYVHGGFHTLSDYKIVDGIFQTVHNLIAKNVVVIAYLEAVVETGVG